MRLSNAARPVVNVLALGVLATAALAGCSGHPTSAPTQAGPIVGDDCPDLAEGGSQVRFSDAHGSALAGVVFGKGATGVVLSHMSDGDVCGWLAYARQLAAGGYQVIVYYFHGYGTSGGGADGSSLDGDVTAAAGYLRDQGARTIALVGASMGAAASLVAATTMRPAPVLVVSLSAPSTYQGLDALGAVANLAVPVLYAAGVGDLQFADAAKALYDATPAATNRTLLVAASSSHGTAMVGGPGSQVRDAMDNALKRQAPTSN
jgi:pimeloyl-ACP methyl ester carboxylesterase